QPLGFIELARLMMPDPGGNPPPGVVVPHVSSLSGCPRPDRDPSGTLTRQRSPRQQQDRQNDQRQRKRDPEQHDDRAHRILAHGRSDRPHRTAPPRREILRASLLEPPALILRKGPLGGFDV